MKIQNYDFFHNNGYCSIGEHDIILQLGTRNFPTKEMEKFVGLVKKFSEQFLERYVVCYCSFPAGEEDVNGDYKESYFCVYLLDNRVSQEEKISFRKHISAMDYSNGIALN